MSKMVIYYFNCVSTFSYDAFNRNTKVEMFNSNVQINHYDSEGLRHEMEESIRLVSFIFRGGKFIMEKTRSRKSVISVHMNW